MYSIDMGVPQFLNDQHSDRIRENVEKAYEYLSKQDIRTCQNAFRECAWFAATGHCESSPTLMGKDCGPVCQSCKKVNKEVAPKNAEDTKPQNHEQVQDKTLEKVRQKLREEADRKDDNTRRQLPPDNDAGMSPFQLPFAKENETPCNWSEDDNVWKTPGFIDKTMHNQNFAQFYTSIGFAGKRAHPPYVLMFEHFISVHEAKYLIHLVNHQMEWNTTLETGNDYDSSTCNHDCQDDVIMKSILRRIELITGIPGVNAEEPEFRRYQNGGRKRMAHDYLKKERQQPQGVRIATFYIFLSSALQDDTSQWFSPSLGSSRRPTTGEAMFWINVKDGDLNAEETRMHYEIKPSTSSTQYALNVYLHQRNYKDTRDC